MRVLALAQTLNLLGRHHDMLVVQHVVAAHAPGARHDVGGGVPLGMTDMQTDAGRVGEHVEDVRFGRPLRRVARNVPCSSQ
jgi:hypothetical protein